MAFSPIELLLALLMVVVAIVAGTYLLVLSLRALTVLVKHIVRYLVSTIGDTVRLVGAIPTALVLCLLVVGSIVLGRWSAVGHFAKAVKREIGIGCRCVYGIALGHPLRLVGMHALVEGLEQRVVEDVRRAPGSDKPSKRTGQFEGYTIIGSLPGGGSGSKLYIAEPTDEKRAHLDKQPTIQAHGGCPKRVVIKSFSIGDGSTLPNMVRESRALEAAKKLGLILEHELSDTRFFYIMEYVPGLDLGEITRQVHAKVRGKRLPNEAIRELTGYSMDLLQTLNHYHQNGLWHKDVKPENIIVHDRKAHLVDFGLVTPLASAMTLTTHGTEYFRDPELVRMALRGVKVNEVDGAKFDVYAAGAVLYYMLENTFPAHGGLSRLSMKHPDALAWIVRRAMTEYNQRYETAAMMQRDLDVVVKARDPFALKPADLPSMRGGGVEFEQPLDPQPEATVAQAGTPRPQAQAAGAAPPPPADPGPPNRKKPSITVTNWWSGRYSARPMQDPREAGREAARKAAKEVEEVSEEIGDALNAVGEVFSNGGEFKNAGDQVRAAMHAARQQVRQSMNQVREQMHQHARAHAPGRCGPIACGPAAPKRQPAQKQVKAARHRAQQHRQRAQERFLQHGHRRKSPGAVAFRVALALGALAAAALVVPRFVERVEHRRGPFLTKEGLTFAPSMPGSSRTSAGTASTGPRVLVNGQDVNVRVPEITIPDSISIPGVDWPDDVPADPEARLEYFRKQMMLVSGLYEAARQEVVEAVSAPAHNAKPAAFTPDVPLGKILLVNNHPAAADDRISDILEAEIERVENVGFTIFRDEDLEANVHRIMAAQLGAPQHEVIPDLAQLLDDNDNPEIRGLVWVTSVESGPGKVECWYVLEGEREPGPLAKGLGYLRSVKPTKGVIANWTTLTPDKR